MLGMQTCFHVFNTWVGPESAKLQWVIRLFVLLQYRCKVEHACRGSSHHLPGFARAFQFSVCHHVNPAVI